MDSVALSLGPTWRSSEEKERLVPSHLRPDGEVRAVLTTAQTSWGQTQTWLPWVWVLATPSEFLPGGIKGHILPLLGSFSLTHVFRGSIQKPEYGEPGRTELCYLQTSPQRAVSR